MKTVKYNLFAIAFAITTVMALGNSVTPSSYPAALAPSIPKPLTAGHTSRFYGLLTTASRWPFNRRREESFPPPDAFMHKVHPMNTSTIKIILADDHRLMREGLRQPA